MDSRKSFSPLEVPELTAAIGRQALLPDRDRCLLGLQWS